MSFTPQQGQGSQGLGQGLFPYSLSQTPCAWSQGPEAGAAKEVLWGYFPGLQGEDSFQKVVWNQMFQFLNNHSEAYIITALLMAQAYY